MNYLVKAYFEGKERFELSHFGSEAQYLGEIFLMLEAYQHSAELEKSLGIELQRLTDDEIRKEIIAYARSLPGFYNFEAFTKQIIKRMESLRKISETYIKKCYEHT